MTRSFGLAQRRFAVPFGVPPRRINEVVPGRRAADQVAATARLQTV